MAPGLRALLQQETLPVNLQRSRVSSVTSHHSQTMDCHSGYPDSHFSIAVTIGIRLSGGSCFPGIRREGFLSLQRANLQEVQQTDKEPRTALLPESEQEVL